MSGTRDRTIYILVSGQTAPPLGHNGLDWVSSLEFKPSRKLCRMEIIIKSLICDVCTDEIRDRFSVHIFSSTSSSSALFTICFHRAPLLCCRGGVLGRLQQAGDPHRHRGHSGGHPPHRCADLPRHQRPQQTGLRRTLRSWLHLNEYFTGSFCHKRFSKSPPNLDLNFFSTDVSHNKFF